MKRHIPGLHRENHNSDDDLEGVFLVRVDRAFYRWHPGLCLSYKVCATISRMAWIVSHLSIKNTLFVVAGVCVIALALIPLVFSVGSQTSWRLLVLGIGVIAILALFGQALLQSKEDKDRDGRDVITQNLLRRVEQYLPKSTSVALTGVQASITANAVLVTSSPRIYPEIKGHGKGLFTKTEIILSNQGSDVAHKVRVEPIVLHSGSITFSGIEILAVGASEHITATVENTSLLSQHNITGLLMRDWDAKGEVTTEFPIPMRIIYEDVLHRQFETTFDLIYLPFKDMVEQNPFEIRNLEIRPQVPPVGL